MCISVGGCEAIFKNDTEYREDIPGDQMLTEIGAGDVASTIYKLN